MASDAQATYVTKYNAGGSGDNIVPDGYIKTVEKVWIDTYTIAFTGTTATIDIAILPANKKVVGIDIELNTTTNITTSTISVGFSTDASIDTFLAETTLTSSVAVSRASIHLPGPIVQLVTETSCSIAYSAAAGFQKVTGGTQTTITIRLDDFTATSGTIRSIVRYT